MIGKKLIHRPAGTLRGLGFWWTFAAALVVAGALILAIAQNGREVRVHYIVWQASAPLIVVILTTALVVLLLDEAGGLVWRRRRRATLGRRSELARLRRERPDQREQEPEVPASAAESSPQAAAGNGS